MRILSKTSVCLLLFLQMFPCHDFLYTTVGLLLAEIKTTLLLSLLIFSIVCSIFNSLHS